jgi:hypothetical protein
MGFCFFLVCSGNDCGLSVRRFFEFLRGGDSAGYLLRAVLQVLRAPKEPAAGKFLPTLGNKKRTNLMVLLFLQTKLSQLCQILSMKYKHKFS